MPPVASLVDPLHDPQCLVTPASVVIDGANGVCHQAREGAGAVRGAPVVLGVLVLAGLVGFASFSRLRVHSPRMRALASIAFALVCALPGLRSVLLVRADAPFAWPAHAAALRARTELVSGFFAQHGGCVVADLRACTACDPLVRYARPVRPARCELGQTGRVEFGPDGLVGPCVRTTPDALVCGQTSR